MILGPYAEATLATLGDAGLDLYEALLDEADADLYRWVSGQTPPPAGFAGLIAEIADFARRRWNVAG